MERQLNIRSDEAVALADRLARALDAPLLFVGADFGHTDVRVHPASVML